VNRAGFQTPPTLSEPSAPKSATEKADLYRDNRIAYWNNYVRRSPSLYYHRRTAEIYKFIIPPGQQVLELGCGDGDLLAALKPSRGVGVDFAPSRIERAKAKYPEIDFVVQDVHELSLDGTFDYVILSDLVNDLWDVEQVFHRIAPLTNPRTRIVINSYNRMWELPLSIVRRINLVSPFITENWFAPEDIDNMLYLSGFETIRRWREILLPMRFPIIDSLFNKIFAKIAPFRSFALSNFIIARPAWQNRKAGDSEPIVSVIVPARNEAGNIEGIFRRLPKMGAGTELILIEDHSTDDTFEVMERTAARFPSQRCRIMRSPGTEKGKGTAVRAGLAAATGDVLMILDADLTVAAEDLPRFYEAWRSGKGEFINGVRLVYPMEQEAMRYINLFGNKFFSTAFSWLLGQKIKDTLCGTKVLSREHYDLIASNRAYFGDFDPFGDFDLIFGAAKLNLKIVDMPIRYAERTYGSTNIARWRHGWMLLKMIGFACTRIKFV